MRQLEIHITASILIFPFLLIGSVSSFSVPWVIDPNFIVEEYVNGIELPTSMIFIDDDLLILEKNTGNVRLVRNDILQEDPILHIDVYFANELGLVGITNLDSSVYLYVSEAKNQGGELDGNRIYKYEWDGETLKDGKLIHELPKNDLGKNRHIGGQMLTSSDGIVYAVIGDADEKGILQNFEMGNFTDSGVILIVNQDESILKPSQSKNPQDHYYAMGIRNSFGLAIDPITGNLWDTENGDVFFDEVNLVAPKFNSGWGKIMGPASIKQIENLPTLHNFQYSDPEFSWKLTIAPTNLIFVNSESFDDYKDFLLVGGFNTGNIYMFKLNSDRTGFVFNDPSLQDLVLNPSDTTEEIIFATGIKGLTDLDYGPDGFLYFTEMLDQKIYRIKPSHVTLASLEDIPKLMKNIAAGWAIGEKKDDEFKFVIEFLLLKRLMIFSGTESTFPLLESIPKWIKNIAGWWADGSISNFEFVKGIEFLVQNGIINVNIDEIKCNIKPGPEINLSGCDLSGKDFSGINLSRTKMIKTILVGSNLTNANLFHADLSGADLSNSILNGISFQGANLQNANLQGAKLENSDLIGAKLINADLSNAVLYGAKAFYAELQNSNLKGSNLENVDFKRANLTNANLSGANLLKTSFRQSIANDADFSETYALKTSFFRTTLKNALFLNANLTEAYFYNNDLSNANLTGADITETRFEKANMLGCIGCPER